MVARSKLACRLWIHVGIIVKNSIKQRPYKEWQKQTLECWDMELCLPMALAIQSSPCLVANRAQGSERTCAWHVAPANEKAKKDPVRYGAAVPCFKLLDLCSPIEDSITWFCHPTPILQFLVYRSSFVHCSSVRQTWGTNGQTKSTKLSFDSIQFWDLVVFNPWLMHIFVGGFHTLIVCVHPCLGVNNGWMLDVLITFPIKKL